MRKMNRFISSFALFSAFLSTAFDIKSDVVISEFMASNGTGLTDEEGDHSDWIEIFNSGDQTVHLGGWHLTDDSEDLQKWVFPPLDIGPQGFLVIFASSKDRRDPSSPLHTNFNLNAAGEYLALVPPNSLTPVTEFNPFPQQERDISFGTGQSVSTRTLLASNAVNRYLVPSNDSLGVTWTHPDFDDSSWSNGRTSLGYETSISGFSATYVKANIAVGQLSTAENILQNPDLQTVKIMDNPSVINYFGTGGTGHYSNNVAFPGHDPGQDVEDFVMEITGTITIPSSGTWTFGVNSDDGFGLDIGEQRVAYPEPRGPADTLGAFTFNQPGSYPLRLVYYERGGGAGVEFFAAQGLHDFWNETDFILVGDIANGGLEVRSLPAGNQGNPGTGSSFATDVRSVLFEKNSSLYVRIPFDLADPENIDSLSLRTRYDDGFAAYLNGTEVARRHAPIPLDWDTTATEPGTGGWEVIAIDGASTLLIEGENVLALQGLNTSADDVDFLLDVELQEYNVDQGLSHYFAEATPGAFNSSGFFAFVKDTKFSVDRGFFDEPFDLVITTDTADATIRYTVDGTAPTLTNGQIYSDPVRISGTTTIRAAAFKDGFEPSNVDTQTYLFPEDVIRQSPNGEPPPGWPSSWGSNTVDYGMDPEVVNDPAYRDTIADDLKSIPTFSIVMKLEDLFDRGTGIYANPSQDGREWERPCSVELIHPDGTEGFQINAGIRIRGGFSRSTSNPKHAFRLFFRNEYGAGKLRYPVFGEDAVDVFDGFDLRTFQNYSWSFQGDGRGIFLRDQVNRDMQLAMGHNAERGDFYHLYINGIYWGLFNTCERPEASYGETYYGGDKEDYDVIKVEAGPYTINATDGNLDAWRELHVLTGRGFANDASYQRVLGNNPDGTRNPEYPVYVDAPNLIDYMLIILYGGNLDAPISNFLGNTRPNNFFSVKNRNLPMGFHHFVHDAEHTLLNVNENRTGPYPAGQDFQHFNPQFLWQELLDNAEFRVKVADHIHKHFFNDGVMTAENIAEMFMERKEEIHRAVVAESARWGDSKRTRPFTRDNEWLNAINTVLNTFISRRSDIVVNQLRQDNVYPDLDAPSFNQHGGPVSPGFELSITGPSTAAIYYTLDGSDPRLLGGNLAPGAIRYADAIALNEHVSVFSRTRVGNTWSALNQADFIIARDFTELVVSELMYHPPAMGVEDGDSFEFIELRNISNESLDLSEVTFADGIQFTFENGTSIEPGQFLILVRDRVRFSDKYPGVQVAGQYSGSLSNGGERISLVHATGLEIFSFNYSDQSPWPITADGQGFSLVPVQLNSVLDLNDVSNWKTSNSPGGSPGRSEVPLDIPSILINEILTHTDLPQVDAVELFNPLDSPADISFWLLTDNRLTPNKFRFPEGTVLGPGGYLVVTENEFNREPGSASSFAFSSFGEEVYLFSANASGELTGYSTGFGFGAAANGVTFGRHVNSRGTVYYPAQKSVTLGQANTGPAIGPVIINEIQYAPLPAQPEFIEIKNISSFTVPLFDPDMPQNTWSLDGVGYLFPEGISLAPNELLVIANVEPDQFKAIHPIPEGVQVLGPYPGNLRNNGENLRLRRPDSPDIDPETGESTVPYILVDEVRYDDTPPWPTQARETGSSLERINLSAFSNDPNHWRASLGQPSPGMDNDGNRAPLVNAGVDGDFSAEQFPLAITLSGSAEDDGLPVPPHALIIEWRQLDGPGKILFANPNDLETRALLPGAGQWTLELSVNDSELATSDRVIVTATRPVGDFQFIPPGSIWLYLDNGSNQGTIWRQTGFNDSSWKSGRAQLGYGDGDEQTVIGFGPNPGNKFVTSYFRHAFNVANPAAVQSLTLHLLRDDGAVVYLNGTEIARSGMPNGIISFNTFASVVAGGADESTFFEFNVPVNGVQQGANVIAVEIHQANGSSSDTSFDLELTGSLLSDNTAPVLALENPNPGEVGEGILLVGQWTDDGLPTDPGVVTFLWSKVSGPGTVQLDPNDLPVTTATFSSEGVYSLRLTISDGESVVSEEITIEITGDNGSGEDFDQWRSDYFTATELQDESVSGRGADPDRDGHDNEMEFRAGTDPRLATSVLSIQNVNIQFGESVVDIRVQSVPGKTYVLEFMHDIANPQWQTADRQTADALELRFNDNFTAEESGRFYRIRLDGEF